ncbi:MAG: exodeoxyribonuclease VII small subunit [Pseudomonadota bacterium]
MKKKEEPKFEAGLARLEELVEALESGGLDLDKSLEVFEEGIKLSRVLNQRLDSAEKKLELLVKDEQGRPETRELDFEPDNEPAGEEG